MDPIVWVVLVVVVAGVAFFIWRRQRGGGEQPTKTLHSSISGVTTEDEHGLSPQQVIVNLQVSDRLTLVATEQDGAPAVQVQDGRQGHLGWLLEGVVPDVREALDAGSRVECKIADITGGTRGNPNLAVSIQIDFY